MMCPHGLGLGHALLDALMYLPFVAPVVFFFRVKRGEKRPGVVKVGDVLRTRFIFKGNNMGTVTSISESHCQGVKIGVKFLNGEECELSEMFFTRPSKAQELSFRLKRWWNGM